MKTRANEWLSIGQVAERTGLAVSAIRHHESVGLVHAERTVGGQRRFRRAAVRRLSFALIAQRLGFSLAEIGAQLARLPRDRAPGAADWTRMARGFRRDIDRRIGELERLRDTLDGCIGCGCLSLERCALYNPDDRASELGAGPRWLLGDSSSGSSSGSRG